MRRLLPGHGASRGSALGRARVRNPHALQVAEQRIRSSEVEHELARLHTAVDAARTEMHDLRARLHGALAREVGEFLELHALLLDDPELLQGLDELIRRAATAPTTRSGCSATAWRRCSRAWTMPI